MSVTGDFRDELTDPGAPGLPERFFDRFVFNLHPPDATTPSILFGLGMYPGAGTVDGFAILVTGTQQRNVRFSTELGSAQLSPAGQSEVGPLRWRVVEPMRIWHVALGPNPTGLEFDLTWTARAPAWTGNVLVGEGGQPATSFAHLFQSGRYRGSLRRNGREERIAGWYGQRDRSRGVRTMSGGQGLHLWVQAQFPDRCAGFLLVEDRQHSRLLLEGAVMHEDGLVDPVTGVRHALRFDDGLDLAGGTLEITTGSGARYVIDADSSGRGGYMAGGGYDGRHGVPRGRDHLEHDTYPLDGSVSPRSLGSALTDRLTAFRWDGIPGLGVFEFAHSRSRSYTYRPTL